MGFQTKHINIFLLCTVLTVSALTFQNCGGDGYEASNFSSLEGPIDPNPGTTDPTNPLEIIPEGVFPNKSDKVFKCDAPLNGSEFLSDSCFWEALSGNQPEYKNFFRFIPKYPLLFDGINDKKRYIYIPDGSKIDNSTDGRWVFPVGTVFLKNFDHKTDSSVRTIETRALTKVSEGFGMDNWEPVTYKWNDSETEATKITAGEAIPITDELTHNLPGENSCTECHSGFNDGIGGFSRLQLDDFTLNGPVQKLFKSELLSQFPESKPDIPGNPNLDPEHRDYAVQLRSSKYIIGAMVANCSGCHSEGGVASFTGLHFDFKLGITDYNQIKIVAKTLEQKDQELASKYIVPGDHTTSKIYQWVNGGIMPKYSNIKSELFLDHLQSFITNFDGSVDQPGIGNPPPINELAQCEGYVEDPDGDGIAQLNGRYCRADCSYEKFIQMTPAEINMNSACILDNFPAHLTEYAKYGLSIKSVKIEKVEGTNDAKISWEYLGDTSLGLQTFIRVRFPQEKRDHITESNMYWTQRTKAKFNTLAIKEYIYKDYFASLKNINFWLVVKRDNGQTRTVIPKIAPQSTVTTKISGWGDNTSDPEIVSIEGTSKSSIALNYNRSKSNGLLYLTAFTSVAGLGYSFENLPSSGQLQLNNLSTYFTGDNIILQLSEENQHTGYVDYTFGKVIRYTAGQSTAHPFCTNNSTDHDKDGWGYENDKSCIVQCQNSSTTADQSGWGFETQNGVTDQKCKKGPASSGPVTSSNNYYDMSYPICTSSDLDDNLDGYGWENQNTCVVKCNSITQAVDTRGWSSHTVNGDQQACVNVRP